MVSVVFREDPVLVHALLSLLESAITEEWAVGGPGENVSVSLRRPSQRRGILSTKSHCPLKAALSTHSHEEGAFLLSGTQQ